MNRSRQPMRHLLNGILDGPNMFANEMSEPAGSGDEWIDINGALALRRIR